MSKLISPDFTDRETLLRDFVNECAGTAPSEQAGRLRDAAILFGLSAVDGQSLEAMLACEAYESAALLVLGDVPPFLLSRGASGCCLASMVLPDGTEEVVAEGATLALALLAAHAAVVLADPEAIMPATLPERARPAGVLLH